MAWAEQPAARWEGREHGSQGWSPARPGRLGRRGLQASIVWSVPRSWQPELGASRGAGTLTASAPSPGRGLSSASPVPVPRPSLLPPPPLPRGSGPARGRRPGLAAAQPGRAQEQPHHLVVLAVQHAGQEERGLLRAACLEAPAGPALAVHGHVPQSLGAGLAPGPAPAGRRAVQAGGVGVVAQLVDALHELALGVVALLRGGRGPGSAHRAPKDTGGEGSPGPGSGRPGGVAWGPPRLAGLDRQTQNGRSFCQRPPRAAVRCLQLGGWARGRYVLCQARL